MTSLPPNTELVACAWTSGIGGVNAAQVATMLPQDNSTWAASGFVQVGPQVGGEPGMYVPMREPVVQISCWTVRPDSRRPPWGQAFTLAETILAGCYDSAARRTVTMPATGYQRALVHAAYPMSEPRRLPRDPGNYACVVFDLALAWTAVQD